MWRTLLDALPRGYDLDEKDWRRRHRMLLWVLALHVPALAAFGLFLGHDPLTVAVVLVVPVACVGAGRLLRRRRRTAAVVVTGGLVYCSAALVGLSHGSIEAHFHLFVIIGFVALYQDWAPFLFTILFTGIGLGIGSARQPSLVFSTAAGQADPWLWSLVHGVAVLCAWVGMMLFWRVTEDAQREKDALSRRLAEAEIGRQRFTSDLLTNLARRNQSLLYRQLEIINQLEESEQDPDALAELFALDHLATRVRRNAESLLVLAGEQPPRTWSEPVPLRDVLRAAIAETEDLDRVVSVADERPAVAGHTVTDLTHLVAELTENAVRFSPPDTTVTIRARPGPPDAGGFVVTVEDWGVGMAPAELDAANALLAAPPEVDLSVSQRLGFHVVARLAARHGVQVSLDVTAGSGITATALLPAALFIGPPAVEGGPPAPGYQAPGPPPAREDLPRRAPAYAGAPGSGPQQSVLQQVRTPFGSAPDEGWSGWWEPDAQPAGTGAAPAPAATPAAAPPVLLRRRVPQSHLNAQLRQPGAEIPAAAPSTTADAATALSRYQASRAAAQAVAENGHRT